MARGRVFALGKHEYIERYCRTCFGATCSEWIAFAQDKDGNWHPFDTDTGHSHYSTCVDVDRFRDVRKKMKGGRRR